MKDLKEKVIVITGASTGLGLALARKLAKEGSILAICARSEEDLELTKIEFITHGYKVFTSVCDVAEADQVEAFIEAVLARFGKIDVLVNNAGIMTVGSMESFALEEYETCMNIMYWGIVHTTRAVLPYFKSVGSGQIVNVTSIGGMVAIPQMSPYVAAKFAATGYSMALSAELAKDNITVSTVVPGLMRTGSFINAFFQKNNRKEFKLFSVMSTAPFITISAEKAVNDIIGVIRKKKKFMVLGMPAKIIRQLYHFLPNTLISAFGQMDRFIPVKLGPAIFEKGGAILRRFPRSELPVLKDIARNLRKNYQHAEERHAGG